MWRTLFIAAFGAVLGGAACEGDPEDPFFLYGRVRDASGRPLARVSVALSRGEGEICLSRRFGRSFSEQIAWPGQKKPSAALEAFKHTEPDDNGRFLFQLLRYEFAAGTFCFRIDVESGKGGAKTRCGLRWANRMRTWNECTAGTKE
jgi:hypothetical protein